MLNVFVIFHYLGKLGGIKEGGQNGQNRVYVNYE